MSKKGLSPIIATVLLVALVLVLASIIYLWARAFIPETIEKDGSTIENSCPDVAFGASYSISTKKLTIQNNGNIPIYGIRYGVEKVGTLAYEDLYNTPIVTGGSVSYIPDEEASQGENIRVIPILLGKSSNGALKGFACEESVKVIAV